MCLNHAAINTVSGEVLLCGEDVREYWLNSVIYVCVFESCSN